MFPFGWDMVTILLTYSHCTSIVFSTSQAKWYLLHYYSLWFLPRLKSFLDFPLCWHPRPRGARLIPAPFLLSTQLKKSLIPQRHRRLPPWALTHVGPATRNALPHHLLFPANSQSASETQPKNHFLRKALPDHLFRLCICTSTYNTTCAYQFANLAIESYGVVSKGEPEWILGFKEGSPVEVAQS